MATVKSIRRSKGQQLVPQISAAPATPEEVEAAERVQFAAHEKAAWETLQHLVRVLEDYTATIRREVVRRDCVVERAARQAINEVQNLHRNLPLADLLSAIEDVAASRARLEKYGDRPPARS